MLRVLTGIYCLMIACYVIVAISYYYLLDLWIGSFLRRAFIEETGVLRSGNSLAVGFITVYHPGSY